MLPESWNLNQILYGMLTLYMFVLPIHLNTAIGLFAVMLILNLVNTFKTRQFWPDVTIPKKVSRPLWALFLLSGLSVIWSPEPFLCGYNWFCVVGLEAGSFYLMLRYGSTGRRSLFLVKVFMISAGFVAFYGIWQYFFGVPFQDIEWIDHSAFPLMTRRAVSTLENPNILASFLVMTVAYSEGLFAPLKGGKRRVSLVVIFLAATGCLMLTFSRGNWIAFFFVLFVFAGAFYHKAFLPFIGGGLGVLYLGWDHLANRIMSIFSIEDTSAELRVMYLDSATDMIKEHPFGVGWYGYQFVFPDYNFGYVDPEVIMYHSHNILTNVAAELGLIGLALFLYIMWQLLKMAREIRHRRTADWVRGMACGYIASLVGIFVAGMTDYTLFNIQLGIFFWLFNAMLIALDSLTQDAEPIDE
jgi:putative inorganic carbon (HCO3(-)) transporter